MNADRPLGDYLVALLEASERASVLMVSSIAGVTGIGSSVAYAASKGALNTMTIDLARALAPKIRVNALCPGFIDTPWHAKGLTPDQVERMREGTRAVTPLKAASSPEDIAGETFGKLVFGRLIDLEKRSGISRLRSDPILRRRYDGAQLRRQYTNVCLKRVDIEFGRDGAVFGNGRGEVIAMSGCSR